MRILTFCAVIGAAIGCAGGKEAKPAASADSAGASAPGTALVVMNAASVTQPVRAVLDSFSAKTGEKFAQRPGASLELARLVTELHQHPDVILLADPDVFPKVLMPQYVQWYAVMARNRIVLAYTERSRGAAEISADNWRTIIPRPGVEVGRADPNTDPSGYRTLLTMQLAERFYREPGLYKRLLTNASEKNVRPREAEQVALLQTHELDYIWTYQNLAENDGLRYVKLADDIDLGNPADSAAYAQVTTRVVGKNQGDTLVMRGAPILFAVTIPKDAPHRELAEKFVAYLLSADGRRIMRARHFDALDKPIVFGSGAPAAIVALDDPAPVSAPTPAPGTLELQGLDGVKRTLTRRDIDALPSQQVTASAHGVTGTFKGASLADVLRLVHTPAGDSLRGAALADYVLIEAADNYRAVFALAELDAGFTDRVVLLADQVDGKPLAPNDGPFRIIVPGEKRPARWVRQVIRVSVRQP